MEKESRCKWCGTKIADGATACSVCSKKVKLVRQLKATCEAIKKGSTHKPDMVDVVRCKDCIFCANEISYYCRKHMVWVDANEFCSYGRRGRK